jgi:signal transduction histidine kinase
MDPTLASSLVANLLKNAFVHNKPNGSIVIRLKNNMLIISNTGIKEPLDEDAVFQTFYKKGESAHSSGLGLAICKEVVTLMGGKIRLKSELGKGTIVWIIIPCKCKRISR